MDHRCERIFVMLDEPVPGLDHLKAVDAEEFAWHGTDNLAESLGLTPLGYFCSTPFDRPRWHPSAEGLATLRALISHFEKRISDETGPDESTVEMMSQKLQVLQQVEAVLDAADTRDRNFYFAVRDAN